MLGGLAVAQINLPMNLEVLDTAVLEETDFGPNMDRWLSNIVDIINQNFDTISNALVSLIAVGQTDVGGGGAGPIMVAVTGLEATNFVNVNLIRSSNVVTISTVQVIANGFNITFSGDPGAVAVITYQAFVTKPQ